MFFQRRRLGCDILISLYFIYLNAYVNILAYDEKNQIKNAPLVTSFLVFPLWTLSFFRFTAKEKMAKQACVSTLSTSMCDCEKERERMRVREWECEREREREKERERERKNERENERYREREWERERMRDIERENEREREWER